MAAVQSRASFGSSAGASSRPRSSVLNELIAIDRHFNGLCRGAVTEDDTLRDTICDLRDRLYNTLRRRGICYGKRAQTGADMRWDRCTRDSLAD